MRTKLLVLCLVLGVWAGGDARASSISVYFAPDATDIDGTAVPFVPFFTYFIAVLGGDAAASGITGAEFRADGYDAAWFNTVTPNPLSNLSLGSPIAGGCNIAFPVCQTGTGGAVLLYSVQSIALSSVTPRFLIVARHTTPSNANFPCPLVTLCDTAFTLVCVQAGQGCLNHPSSFCDLAVESTTWGEVKRLFN